MRTNKPKRNTWLDFNIYPELSSVKAMAKAKLDDKNELTVKLQFKAPRGQFYGFQEDARTEALRIFSKYYQKIA